MCKAIYFQCKNERENQCANPGRKEVQPPGFPQKVTMVFGSYKHCDEYDAATETCKATGLALKDAEIIGLPTKIAFQCSHDNIREIEEFRGRFVGAAEIRDIRERQESNARYYETLETISQNLREVYSRHKERLEKELEDRKRDPAVRFSDELGMRAEGEARELGSTIYKWMSGMPERRSKAATASSDRIVPSISGSAARPRPRGKRVHQSTNNGSGDKSASRPASQASEDRVTDSYEPSDAGDSQMSKKKGKASAAASPKRKKQKTPRRKGRKENDE